MIEITMQNGGTIRIELDKTAAPITVENFEKLASKGFYDGLTFHRVIPGFFIMHADAPHLDGDYAAFGHVVEGMDVVDEIAAVTTDFRDMPKTPVVMKTVRVVE